MIYLLDFYFIILGVSGNQIIEYLHIWLTHEVIINKFRVVFIGVGVIEASATLHGGTYRDWSGLQGQSLESS